MATFSTKKQNKKLSGVLMRPMFVWTHLIRVCLIVTSRLSSSYSLVTKSLCERSSFWKIGPAVLFSLSFFFSMWLLRNNAVKLHSFPPRGPRQVLISGSEQSSRLLLDMTFDLRLVPLSNTSPQQLLPPPSIFTICPLLSPPLKKQEQRPGRQAGRQAHVTLATC